MEEEVQVAGREGCRRRRKERVEEEVRGDGRIQKEEEGRKQKKEEYFAQFKKEIMKRQEMSLPWNLI